MDANTDCAFADYPHGWTASLCNQPCSLYGQPTSLTCHQPCSPRTANVTDLPPAMFQKYQLMLILHRPAAPTTSYISSRQPSITKSNAKYTASLAFTQALASISIVICRHSNCPEKFSD